MQRYFRLGSYQLMQLGAFDPDKERLAIGDRRGASGSIGNDGHFAEKFAVDQVAPKTQGDIHWHTLDLNAAPALPFEDKFFNVVTMLAVTEHLNPDSLVLLFRDIYRVLRPGGILILTTPASWSDGLLHTMAHIGLVSKEEIHEHVYAYSLPLLGWYFGAAGFSMTKVRFGYFEFGLNLWGLAER